MFSSTQPRSTLLNAIPPHPTDPTQAQHRAENLAACLELRDLGLQLARAAAARALAAHEHQTHAPEPEAPQTTPKPTDPDLAFARHSRSVRQSVELWEKITNNTFARRPQSRHQSWPDSSSFDPDSDLDDLLNRPHTQPSLFSESDRGNLYEAVGNLALIHPNHADIPETLHEIIAETLTAYPDDHLSANFARVCQAFDIEPDRTRLQPHLESQLRPPDHYPKRE